MPNAAQASASASWTIFQVVTEVGSRLNGHRPKLTQLLVKPKTQPIVIEQCDGFTRFGAE